MRLRLSQDHLLFTSLFVFGLVMIAGAFAVSVMVRDQLLHDDGMALAERWSAAALPVVQSAEQPNDMAVAAFALKAQAQRDGVQSLRILRNDGTTLLDQRIGAEGGLRPGGLEQVLDQAIMERVMTGHVHSETVSGDEEGRGTKLTLTAPVISDLSVVGIVQVTVDQSRVASLLANGLGLIATGTALTAWIGFFIPTFITYRRMKGQVQAESRMQHIAHHDALTDLPNRTLFNDRLERALIRAQRSETRVAVMCIDLDMFKNVNDTLGHPVGDALLCEVARRLKEAVRDVDTVARLGGDEFVIIAEQVRQPENVITLARWVTESLQKPYELNGHRVISGGSAGIAMTPEDGLTPAVLLKNADLALYRAKADGRGGFRFFEAEMDADLQRRRNLEIDLQKAISEEQFVLHYQAQYDAASGTLTGYEALIRWPHPVRGLVPPNDFIPVAEECGLIVQIGEWVLRTACAEALKWDDGVRLAVNVSPAQFRKSDIAGLVARVMAETGLPAHRLEIEITEAVLLQNSDVVIAQLTKLRALGVALAMDDFGTGYSSLSYLARFPFDKIKIDGSFVRRMNEEPKLAAIVHTIVGLGNRLDMKITAEGVETEDQVDALRLLGDIQLQGFLFGKPTAEPRTGGAAEAQASNETAVREALARVA